MDTYLPNVSDQPKLMKMSDSEIRNGIWGPWYWYISVFGLVFPASKKETCFFAKVLFFLPNVFVLSVLAVRALNIMYVMSKTRAVSFPWAYMTILFALSVHALICASTLTWYSHGYFFTKMTTYIQKLAFAGGSFATVPKLDLILQFLVIAVACFPTYLLYILDSFSMVRNHSNDNSTVVAGIYRDKYILYLADIPIVILSAYATSTVFIAYLLSNSAVCRHFDVFYTKLTKSAEDGTLSKLDNIRSFDKQLSILLSSIVYLNTMHFWMFSVTFVTGVIIQICGQLFITTFSAQLNGVEFLLGAFWFVQSVSFMIISLKKPSMFKAKLVSTKNLLWLDHNIWTTSTDIEVLDIIETMINRIDTVDYPANEMAKLFIMLLALPWFVALLVGTAKLQTDS